MRDHQAQILFFENHGLMIDCSTPSDRQIDKFLCINPRPKLSDNETLGELFRAAFGKGVHLPVAIPEYERLSTQTLVEAVHYARRVISTGNQYRNLDAMIQRKLLERKIDYLKHLLED